VAAPAVAAPKTRKKRVSAVKGEEDLRMWDGSVADVSWVDENTKARPAPRRREERDWFTLSVTGGHRVFQLETPMIQTDEAHQPINEGQFADLIETKNSLELRAVLHPFSFLSLGAAYHTDESNLRINDEAVPIAPQEFLGLVQLGPRFGFVRLYGFYSQIFSSRSQASIHAPTVVGDTQSAQTFKVDVKQQGGEAGVGTQFYWGPIGFHAEALRSVNRTYDLTMTDGNGTKTFQANARPSFKAWQFGLSLNF
jgi:hypothetical protein